MEGQLEGLVIKAFGAYYHIYYQNQVYIAQLRGRMRIKGKKGKHPVSVGDKVSFEPGIDFRDGLPEASIVEVLPRHNSISRAFLEGESVKEHILAANIDYVFCINSIISPDLRTGFIDRVLITAQLEEITPVIVLNKADLVQDHLEDFIGIEYNTYKELGYHIEVITAHNPTTLTGIDNLLTNKVALFVGHSGVGKSTLVNQLLGEERQYTQPVSELTYKGRHTTTNPELVAYADSGWIIDTPGVREFGLYGVDKEMIRQFYPEIFAIQSQCRFGNKCYHDHEPGCVVKTAVEDEQIATFRYENYLRILHNIH